MTENLADYTTFHLGGPARRFVTATDVDALQAAVTEADEAGEPVLLLGGGSNLLVADEGFAGTVVRIATSGVDVESSDEVVIATVAAGESWDGFVVRAVESGWAGVECLSGIPGLVGSTPIQNVGAYGADVAQVIAAVRVFDRRELAGVTLSAAQCRFGYRDSLFKRSPGRYIVLSVEMRLRTGDLSEPVRYPELANRLNVAVGDRAPIGDVRDAVVALRRSKGMVIDPQDHDTWSAGSFFTNPFVTPQQAAILPAEAPRFPQDDGTVKTSAAWLISHAGFAKGFGTPPATLSTKHVLALTNRGGASAADILGLARTVRAGVERAYGIVLEPEPNLVGCAL